MRVKNLRCRVQGSGSRLQGFKGSRVQGFKGSRVGMGFIALQDVGLKICGLGLRV